MMCSYDCQKCFLTKKGRSQGAACIRGTRKTLLSLDGCGGEFQFAIDFGYGTLGRNFHRRLTNLAVKLTAHFVLIQNIEMLFAID